MIECNYILERMEGKKKNIYEPAKILKKIPNLSYIKAPNSYGKSTFLNMIALGFFSQNNMEVNEDLQKDIQNLVSGNNQKLKFQFEIENNKCNTKLSFRKKSFDDADYDVFEIKNNKEQRLTPQSITKKFKVIYDLPRNPKTRLKQLTEEVKEEQSKYGSRIQKVRIEINRIISEIQDSKDPDYILTLKKTINESTKKHESNINDLEDQKNNLDGLENYFFYRMYNYYLNQYNTLIKEKTNIKLKDKKIQKNVKKTNTEYYREIYCAKEEITRISNLHLNSSDNIKRLLSKGELLFGIWERINFNNTLEDLNFDEKLEPLILRIKNELTKERDRILNDKNTQEASIYQKIIAVLENEDNQDLRISILNKSLREFLQDLKNAQKEKSSNLEIVENLNLTIGNLDQIDKIRSILEKTVFPKIRKLRPTISKNDKELLEDDSEEQLEKIEVNIKKIKEQFEYFEAQYKIKGSPKEIDIKKKLGIKLHSLESLNESQLKQKIQNLTRDIETLNSENSEIKRHINNLNHEVKDLESKEEHPYKKYEKKLKEINNVIIKLDTKINVEFSDYLNEIRSEKAPKEMKDEQIKYTEAIFQYLGKRLGKILIHTGEQVNVSSVDLFKGTLESSTGGIYQIAQMGTGQSQAAYLLGLLNTDDKRLIVALFDEVGMMDEKSLGQIISKLQKLNSQGRIFIGLIVQKRDGEGEVISLSED